MFYIAGTGHIFLNTSDMTHSLVHALIGTFFSPLGLYFLVSLSTILTLSSMDKSQENNDSGEAGRGRISKAEVLRSKAKV